MSDRMMLLMILAYVVIAAASFIEGKHGRGVYFFGAIVLSVGVLMQR